MKILSYLYRRISKRKYCRHRAPATLFYVYIGTRLPTMRRTGTSGYAHTNLAAALRHTVPPTRLSAARGTRSKRCLAMTGSPPKISVCGKGASVQWRITRRVEALRFLSQSWKNVSCSAGSTATVLSSLKIGYGETFWRGGWRANRSACVMGDAQSYAVSVKNSDIRMKS